MGDSSVVQMGRDSIIVLVGGGADGGEVTESKHTLIIESIGSTQLGRYSALT